MIAEVESAHQEPLMSYLMLFFFFLHHKVQFGGEDWGCCFDFKNIFMISELFLRTITTNNFMCPYMFTC